MNKNDTIHKLHTYRQDIENNLAEIENILRINFPEEYSIASQHWIVQIKTALKDNLPYLPRGEYTMDYTLNRIEDKFSSQSHKGVYKYV